MHPDKAHVATAQEGASPFILVWNSTCKTTRTKARLQLGADKNGVSQVRDYALKADTSWCGSRMIEVKIHPRVGASCLMCNGEKKNVYV